MNKIKSRSISNQILTLTYLSPLKDMWLLSSYGIASLFLSQKSYMRISFGVLSLPLWHQFPRRVVFMDMSQVSVVLERHK